MQHTYGGLKSLVQDDEEANQVINFAFFFFYQGT
jgi:hypothetical protein